MPQLDLTEVLDIVVRRSWERVRAERARFAAEMPPWDATDRYVRSQFRERIMEPGLVDLTAQTVVELLAARTQDAGDLFELAALPSGSVVRPAGDRGVAELVDDAEHGLALRRGDQVVPLAEVDEAWFPFQVLVVA